MGVRRLRLAATLVAAAALAPACTDGTTPDCSDAQCLIPSVVDDATDEGDAPEDAQAAEAGDAMGSSDAHDADIDSADGAFKDSGHPSDSAGGG
jgi:hypothetical protein